MKSYDNVDYRLRMRKFVEREMIKESCQRLYYFEHLDKYRYIGFGSLYFVDFKLFHKDLGINDMMSIEFENDENKKLRFEFNKPYDFIKMNYKISTEALNDIKFDKRSIVWLDYDENLKKYMFDDVEILLDNMTSGSVFIISLNASINGKKTSKLVIELNKLQKSLKNLLKRINQISLEEIQKCESLLNELILYMNTVTDIRNNRRQLRKYCNEFKEKLIDYSNNEKKFYGNIKEIDELNIIITSIISLLENEDNCREKNLRVDRFKKDYNGFTTRQSYKESDLSDKKSHVVIKEMFDVHIQTLLKYINKTRNDEEKLIYKQLYYFTYNDRASMLTFGGILYEKREEQYYNRACFDELEYVRTGDEEYNIAIPSLTEKEKEYLNNPFLGDVESASVNEVQKSELKTEFELYKRIYRYLPCFINADKL